MPRHANTVPSGFRNCVPATLRCLGAASTFGWKKPAARTSTRSADALRQLDAVEPKERSRERRRGTIGVEAALAEPPPPVLVDVRRDAIALDALHRIERARVGTRQASTRLRSLGDHARRERAGGMDRPVRARRAPLGGRVVP